MRRARDDDDDVATLRNVRRGVKRARGNCGEKRTGKNGTGEKEGGSPASKAHKSWLNVRAKSSPSRASGRYEILNRGSARPRMARRLLFQINVRPVKRGRM